MGLNVTRVVGECHIWLEWIKVQLGKSWGGGGALVEIIALAVSTIIANQHLGMGYTGLYEPILGLCR